MAAGVKCPHCDGFLFTLKYARGAAFRTQPNPAIKQEADKYFMTCSYANCEKRIDLDWGDVGVRISPYQREASRQG